MIRGQSIIILFLNQPQRLGNWNFCLFFSKKQVTTFIYIKKMNVFLIHLKTTKIKTAFAGGFLLVGTDGFEPSASCSQSKRSTRLSYVPLLILYFIIIPLPPWLCSPCSFSKIYSRLSSAVNLTKLHLSSKKLPPEVFSSSSPKQARLAG